MTPNETPPAWTSLSREEQIEWLARFMGVTVVKRKGRWFKETCGGGGVRDYSPWSVLENWNIWRQIELKVIENPTLWEAFVKQPLLCGTPLQPALIQFYMAANLTTRCSALYSAFHSLP